MGIAIAIIVVLVLAAIAVIATTTRAGRSTTGKLSRETRSRDTEAAVIGTAVATVDESSGRARSDETRESFGGVPAVAEEGTVAKWEPIDEEEIGITRRQFFNRGILGAVGLGVGAFGLGVIAFLWPSSTGGFGGVVKTGRKLDDILAEIAATKTPAYFAEARAYVNPYPVEDVDKAIAAGYPDPIVPALEEGYIVLYQKCPHLGCRVPWCHSSQWFECPCHGSKYNRVGEKRDGPAPRGMTLWRSEVGGDGALTIDTGVEFAGMPIGTDTTDQKREGPACV